jgi:hypothetical protein
MPSGTATSPATAGKGYDPGHATAEETLPGSPGADASAADAASTTMKDEGNASLRATMEKGSAASGDASADNGAMSDTQSASTNPGASTTTMQTMDQAASKPNPSTGRIAAMTSDDLVDKPVEDANGEELGEIGAIVVDRDATPHAYAVVEYGGIFGIGEKQVLVDLDKLELTADGSIRVPVTDEEGAAAQRLVRRRLVSRPEAADCLRRSSRLAISRRAAPLQEASCSVRGASSFLL